MKTQIYLNDQNISDFIIGNSFSISQNKSEPGQVLINSIPGIQGIDTSGFWNPLNPVSIFYGVNDFTLYTIKIISDSSVVFEGFIQNITRNSGDSGIVDIELQSEIQRLLETNIIYTSGGDMNPSKIFAEVCDLYKIKYDPVSQGRSNYKYELDEIKCSVSILKPEISILEFFDQLSQVGIASIFSIGNVLYFNVYENNSISEILYELNDTSFSDAYFILTEPTISNVKKDIPSGYSIKYKTSTPPNFENTLEYGDQKNSFSIDGGSASTIKISNLQSATWTGENWMRYLNRTDSQISFDISSNLASELHVDYTLKLIMRDGTIPFNFKITGLTFVDNVRTNLTGVGWL